MLLGCFSVQKLYGRDPGSIEAINQVFHAALGRYPADQVERAFRRWLDRSQEFPTPADIAGLVRRGGRPPLAESEFVAISRKDGADRTPEEWQFLRDWRAEQEGWDEPGDARKDAADRAEVARLRQEVKALRDENARLAEHARQVSVSKGLERPRPSEQERITRTADAMRATGAPQADIDEFLRQYGVAEQADVDADPRHESGS